MVVTSDKLLSGNSKRDSVIKTSDDWLGSLICRYVKDVVLVIPVGNSQICYHNLAAFCLKRK